MEIETDTRKALALAAFLALNPSSHQREELAALLYPDADPAHARAALRRTLSTLKHALGEEVLEIDREAVALELDQVQVDVLEFRRLIQERDAAALARAIALYRGDFMAGLTLRDSPAFDEWQFFETESLRKQFAAALEALVEIESAHGNFKSAIERARRWLALDPLHEPAHRALMLLYARAGQQAAALRQYQECVRQLERELGVAPLPETTALFHAIQDQRGAQDQRSAFHSAAPAPVPVRAAESLRQVQTELPLVGRAQELATLSSAYAAIQRAGGLLIIQGEAGIGKTRLAGAFLASLRARGARILVARCYAEQQALAYAPFQSVLHAALKDPALAARVEVVGSATLSAAARLVPELAPVKGSELPTGPGSQAYFFDAVTRLLLTLAQGPAPGVLFFDDAQWLDDASLDLLAFVARRLPTEPLVLLLTWREQEIASDHILRRLYADLAREGRATLLSLQRLNRPAVSELVRAALHRKGWADDALVERLWRESEGQPFFLVEYLKLVEQEGPLGSLENLFPGGTRELLRSRLGQTGKTARQVLDAGAVIGRSFELDIVQAVSGRGEEETIGALEELTAQGLLVETTMGGAPQYDFTHDKLRALVYEETSLARRRLLHRRTGDALAVRARGRNVDSLAAQIAQHYRAGGAEALAAEFYTRAGDYARAVFANRDALDYYTTALALGAPDVAAIHESLGDMQTLLGAYEAALAAFETSAAFGKRVDAKLGRVYLRRGEWDRAVHQLQVALDTTESLALQAQSHADLALAEHHAGRDGRAAREAELALDLAQQAGTAGGPEPRALAQAHNILGILARTHGDWATAQEHLEQSAALAETLNDDGARAAALNNLALVVHARGQDARALELTRRALELVARMGDRHREAALHDHLADLYHSLGRSEESMQQLKQAVAIYSEIGGEGGSWEPAIWKLEEW